MPNFFRRLHRRWLYPVLSFSVVLGLCVGTPIVAKAVSWFDLIQQSVQLVQLSKLSDQQEVSIGRQINEQLAQQYQFERDPQLNAYVNQVGQRIAANSDRPNIPYKYQIVKDKSINAFATAGGFVYVHTGLLKIADNEAQLASVLGHETGHISARHLVKQMKRVAVERGLANVAGINQSAIANIGLELAINRPRSRANEYEADQRGLIFLGRTGYDQTAMVEFMRKLLNSKGAPSFLSDHPGTSERITALKQSINSARINTGAGLDNAAYKAKISSLL